MSARQDAKALSGAGAQSALKFLADNGDWIAKFAIGVGLGYTAAVAVLLIAGGTVAIVVAKSILKK